MAVPTPNTRLVAHGAVGIAGGAVAVKFFGKTGLIAFIAGFVLVAWLHAQFDAPLAKGMAAVGLQF